MWYVLSKVRTQTIFPPRSLGRFYHQLALNLSGQRWSQCCWSRFFWAYFRLLNITFSLCISSICAVVSQYAGGKYRKLIKQAGLTQTMNRNGQCLDNALLKKALVQRQHFKTCAQAKAAICEYIEVFYNRQRRRSGIGYQTPQQACNYMTWKMAA